MTEPVLQTYFVCLNCGYISEAWGCKCKHCGSEVAHMRELYKGYAPEFFPKNGLRWVGNGYEVKCR